MKKIIMIIITIVGIIAIGSGSYLLINQSKTKDTKEPEKEYLGADSGLSPKEFYNWEVKLSEKAIKIFDSIYTEASFDFTKYSEYKVSLEDLRVQYNQDFNEFNTTTVSCNLKNCIITVTEDEEHGGLYTMVKLDCINQTEKK